MLHFTAFQRELQLNAPAVTSDRHALVLGTKIDAVAAIICGTELKSTFEVQGLFNKSFYNVGLQKEL